MRPVAGTHGRAHGGPLGSAECRPVGVADVADVDAERFAERQPIGVAHTGTERQSFSVAGVAEQTVV